MNCFAFSMGEGSKIYTEFRYPAGEMQVRLTTEGAALARAATEIRLTAAVRSADDIVRLALLKNSLDGVNPLADASLILPYLPYARADRRFVEGDCFGITAFAGLIQSMGFRRVVTLDAHSHKAGGCFRNLLDVSPMRLIERAIARFANADEVEGLTVLYPDEGAALRYALPDLIGNNALQIKIQALHCSKKRDPQTGALSGFDVPKRSAFFWDHALIVDDICDGGGTFIGIADALADHGLKLGLYVTHGIFSKGFTELAARFARIYTTDSTDHRFTHEDCHTFETSALIAAAIKQQATNL